MACPLVWGLLKGALSVKEEALIHTVSATNGIVSSSNSYVEALPLTAMVCGGGAFGGSLGLNEVLRVGSPRSD